jgi:hypothetical protein
MTDLPVPPHFPAPPGAPIVPPGSAVGRPGIWQTALIVLALGTVAGGSCAVFLQKPTGGSSDLYAFLFFASVIPAAGAIVLLVFRLWRRRQREAWPSVAQAVLMAVAGAVLAGGGCGGWAMTMEAFVPLAIALFVLFVVGLVVAVGAGELFVISVCRLIFKRPGAR